ncbi:MAG: SDR family NAD(P)-dependent oxidoreductase [Cylindrospermopsis raciborskii KL1]|jgi:NAD(P)-dependent dehydrogenase (short-subunit alcohol dehydrogenase family)|uniref:SDR family NAD(P)-dependent oxidoreductase n=1 Tax=Cylindrospermopsis raciborskii TaxID=77022 RepID=UPI001A2A280B|nr:SDR family NAD(P)-dependent oxidoreductase [Cylindrospermopsis raciborskii]MBG0743356.1 SDR family NAD(P)-dependent oxidoreductase [Cylindrospermopsis raciborskii KL1]
MNKNLQGKIALVTGATRGIGKGIAIGLGEAGATVYITGRTLEPVNDNLGGSLRETQEAVEKVGGICIPIQLDHSQDEEIKQLFERIYTEQNGKLDILVNNAYSGVEALRKAYSKPFWESEPNLWDASNNVGLRSHYLASIYAARMMTKHQQGVIFTVSSWGGISYIFSVPYGVGKSACDRLAADLAKELKDYNVASIALYPGIVGTEQITLMAQEQSKDNTASSIFADGYNWETPLLTGRVISALASDSNLIKRTGKIAIVAEVAKQYKLVDENGKLPASLRSLRFILPMAFPVLKQYSFLIPDFKIPWFILLLTMLSSPKI